MEVPDDSALKLLEFEATQSSIQMIFFEGNEMKRSLKTLKA